MCDGDAALGECRRLSNRDTSEKRRDGFCGVVLMG